MRPYKENLLNNFAIINEVFLFIVGCYLFLFADDSQKQSTLKFYCNLLVSSYLYSMGYNWHCCIDGTNQYFIHISLQDL